MLRKHQAEGGFFYVVNLDDRKSAVTLDEVERDIFRAERMLEGAREK